MFGFWKKKKKREPPAGFNPETDTGESKPVRAFIAAMDSFDKYSDYPSEGLDPVKLARIFKEADQGDVRSQMELFEEMEGKDTHLFSQLQTRKLAVTGLDWEIQPCSDSEQDKEIAAFVTKQLEALENLEEIFLDMLDAIGKGISISEIQWGVDEQLHNCIKDIKYIHPKKLIWDSVTDEMKICTVRYPGGISLPKNKFVVHKYKAKSGHPSKAGILRVAAYMYLFKNYDIKDWVSFCEVFGTPLRLGKYPQGASKEDKETLIEALHSLGTDAAGIIPENAAIEFIEANKQSSIDLYERFARYCDEQMSKAILGQTLTSDSGGGSYAQSKTHDNVRHDLTKADAKALAVTIRRDIIRPLVLFNYGANVSVPAIGFDCEEAEDQKQDAEVFDTLINKIGLPITKKYLYKKFRIPKPEDGEEICQRMENVPAVNSFRLSDKENFNISREQELLDDMSEQAKDYLETAFKHMVKPLVELAKEREPEEIKELLQDGDELERLYDKMPDRVLQDILYQGIYLSELIGRSMDA